MKRSLLILTLLVLNAGGMLFAQKGVNPAQRYFRLVCLVHLTGSGKAGDPIFPEYVAEGTAIARAAITDANAAGDRPQASTSAAPVRPAVGDEPNVPPTFATSSRPGILGWSMQITDDKSMAIVEVVAADRRAFDTILADKRQEIRVFEIGKDKNETIEAEMRKYKKDFSLDSLQVVVR